MRLGIGRDLEYLGAGAGLLAWPPPMPSRLIDDNSLSGDLEPGGSYSRLTGWFRTWGGLLTVGLWCWDPDIEEDVFLILYRLVPVGVAEIIRLSGRGK